SRSALTAGSGSSGPMRCARPSTVAQFQPDRMVADMVGRARRFASLTLPYVTNASEGRPVDGCAVTPAFTSDDWILPSARDVDTTAGPCSAAPSAATSSRVVTRRVCPAQVAGAYGRRAHTIGVRTRSAGAHGRARAGRKPRLERCWGRVDRIAVCRDLV